MEDIEKLVESLSCMGVIEGRAATALAALLTENERLRSNCYPRDGVEAIIRERDAYKAELAAERAKYGELQRYNVDCTKACDRQMVEILELREQNARLAESQRRERAAVEDMEHIALEIEKCDWILEKDGEKVGSLHLGRCAVCSHKYCDEEIDGGCKFEWRGPGAGEGVAK